MHLSSQGIEIRPVLGVSGSSLPVDLVVDAVEIDLEGHVVEEVTYLPKHNSVSKRSQLTHT